MKLSFTFLLLLSCCALYAQTGDVRARGDSLFNKSDTVSIKKLDSLQQSFTSKTDSIKQSYAEKKNRLLSLKQKYLARIDSLKSRRPNVTIKTSDSLTMPQPEVANYTHKVDSLDRQLESIQQKTTARIDSLKQKVNGQLARLKLPKEANGKAEQLTGLMNKVSVPAFDSDLAGKVGLNTAVPGVPDVNPNGILPNTNLPNTNLPQVNANIPGADINVPNLKNNLPSTDLNTDKLGEVTGQAGNIQQQVKDATGSTEGLSNVLESKASEQVKGMPDQKLPDHAGLPGGIPKTGDEAKEQLVTMAGQQAFNHFAGKQEVLMSAIEKMNKYKQKYASVSNLKDIKDQKRYNELKGKPLIERLVPALTLQFQSWEDLMLDINPSVGYKFTTHITAGLGWNHRIAYNLPDNAFNPAARIFGIRSYGEYNFIKGFGFRIDIESMNTALPKSIATDVVTPREWVWSAMVGIKQKYPIYRQLKGNAQIMYNLFDKDYRSPYVGRFNARLGFEFTMKKKKTKESTKKKEDS